MSGRITPSHTNVAAGTNALVVHEDGITAFRYEASSTAAEPGWTAVYRYDHADLATLASSDEGVEPPVLGEFSVAIEIECPVERAFDFVADVETHPQYADFVERVAVVSDARRGEDVVFEQVHEGSTTVHETEFVTYDVNERLGWVTHKDDGDIHIEYRFEPTDAGILVVHTGSSQLDDGSPEAFAADRDALFERYRNNETEMANLKALLEDGV